MHSSATQAAKVVAFLVAVTACTNPSPTDTDYSPSSNAPMAQSQERTEPPSTSTGQPTGQEDDTAADAVDPSNGVIAQPAAPPSILQTVRLSNDDRALIYETAQVGTAACMSDLGYDYEWPSYEELNPDGPNMAVTESDARQYGYRLLPSWAETPLSPADLRSQSDESYRRALTGEPEQPDGCNGIAHTRAYDDQGTYAELDQLIGQAIVDARVEVDLSDEYTALNQEWSACMADRGFVYNSPPEPLSRFVGGGGSVTPEESDTRIADLRCQYDAAYERTYGELVNARVAVWAESNQATIDQAATARAEYLNGLAQYRTELGLVP